jgi:hypothetical protein
MRSPSHRPHHSNGTLPRPGRNSEFTRTGRNSNQAVNPPSTFQVMPVMNPASGFTK